MNLNKKQCEQFILNDTINPLTKRNIKKHGPTYKKLENECLQYKKKICKNLTENKIINKKTKKILEKNNKLFVKIKEICDNDEKIVEYLKEIKTEVDIIIKKIKKTDDKLISGENLVMTIMFIYLLQKHDKNIQLFLKKDFTELLEKLTTKKVKDKNLLKTSDYSIMIEIDQKTDKYKNIILPYKNEKQNKIFFEYLKKNKKRFSFILLGIFANVLLNEESYEIEKDSWKHLNVLIYDNKYNEIYRFEPNGEGVDFYNSKSVDNNLKKIFNKEKINYKTLNSYCPLIKTQKKDIYIRYGPQALEVFEKERENDPGGFCAYWTIYFIDFILTNYNNKEMKDKKINEYLEIMMETIKKKYKLYKDFIRTFAIFFNKILKDINKIDKKEKLVEFITEEMKNI